MSLLLTHPELSSRPCRECQRWLYDKETGKKKYRGRQPIARPAYSKPPCFDCPKCDGQPEKNPTVGQQAELSQQNWRCLQAYFEQQGGGGVVDPLARKNFGIIAWTFGLYSANMATLQVRMQAAKPW